MKPRKHRNTEAIGALTIGVLLLACVIVFGGFLERSTQQGGREVTAVFRTTARLAKGSPVRVRGVEAGRLSGMHYDESRRVAVVTLTIFDDVDKLYADARADVRWRTVLGGNYAIDLDPGTPTAGPLRGEIGVRNTSSQVEIDQVLQALHEDSRQGLRSTLTEIPVALADDDGVANAARQLGRAAPPLADALAAVRGSQDGDLRRLVSGTSQTVKGLDTTRRTVRDVVEGGAASLQTTAQHGRDIQTALDRLGVDQPEIRLTLRQLRRTLDEADPLIGSLDDAAPQVAPTAALVRPVLIDADVVLGRAQPLVRSLRPATRALASAARAGVPVLAGLVPILDRVNDTIVPDLAKEDRVTGRATYQMIGPTIASLTAVASMFDRVSHIVSLTGGGGERALDTLPCSTYFTDPTATQLATCEDIGDYLTRILGGPPSRRSR